MLKTTFKGYEFFETLNDGIAEPQGVHVDWEVVIGEDTHFNGIKIWLSGVARDTLEFSTDRLGYPDDVTANFVKAFVMEQVKAWWDEE